MTRLVSLLAILMLFICAVGRVQAESVVELQILQDYFGPAGIKNRTLVYTGEMAQRFLKRPTIGETLPKDAKAEFRVLEENDQRAVYTVLVTTEQRRREWSAFFVRGAVGAKLEAVRSLTLPPYLYETVYLGLDMNRQRTTAEDARYRNLRLVFQTSAEMKDFFTANQPALEEIARQVADDKLEEARAAAKRLDLDTVLPYGEILTEGESVLRAASVGAGGVKTKTSMLGAEIRVGGFFESATGFLYVPPGLTPPVMSPADFIHLEPLAEGWYLFRNIAAPLAQDKKPKTE